MKNIRTVNIWKKEEPKTRNLNSLREVNISDLCLSVRSFNCLKRANCNTVGDILDRMGEEGNGLLKIRNLGTRSEKEIRESVDALKKEYSAKGWSAAGQPTQRLVRPARTTMLRAVDEFAISGKALNSLHASGIWYVRDLYNDDICREPGWFAVRELFEEILRQ